MQSASPRAPVVIVDPVDSGAALAPAFAARQIPAIAVRSIAGPQWDEINQTGYAAKISTADFMAVYDDRPDLVDVLRRHAPLAVIAGAESGVALADALAAALTPALANTPRLTHARRHKAEMQAALERAGLPTIRTLSTACAAEVSTWLEAEGLTHAALVLKPAASAGSDNVHHIPPGGDWRRPFDAILASRTRLRGEANETVVVQERVVGTEFAVDTVSADGDHVLAHLICYTRASIGDRQTVFDHTEIIAFDAREHGEMLRYVRRALDAVGIRWGAAHSEVMLTADGPRLIEIGARTCGGPVLELSRIATGSSQLERVVEAYVDGAILTRSYALATTVVPVFLNAPRAGIIGNIEALDALRALSTYTSHQLWRQAGDHVPQSVDWDTVLGVVALAGERSAVFADLARVRDIESRLRFDGAPHAPQGVKPAR